MDLVESGCTRAEQTIWEQLSKISIYINASQQEGYSIHMMTIKHSFPFSFSYCIVCLPELTQVIIVWLPQVIQTTVVISRNLRIFTQALVSLAPRLHKRSPSSRLYLSLKYWTGVQTDSGPAHSHRHLNKRASTHWLDRMFSQLHTHVCYLQLYIHVSSPRSFRHLCIHLKLNVSPPA